MKGSKHTVDSLFQAAYDAELATRQQERSELDARSVEREKIPDTTAREIAGFISQQEAETSKQRGLSRLGSIAQQFPTVTELGPRVEQAHQRATSSQGHSALAALDREVMRAREDEEFLLLAIGMMT